jgi:L-ascorbate metabolism protein UlaG (beta-lactamase superfamily)
MSAIINGDIKLVFVIIVVLLLLMFMFVMPASGRIPLPEAQLKSGEALIWYLGHSGWAVQTQRRLLIFDYREMKPRPEGAGLEQGYIDPGQVADEKVTVFVSHGHGDHYDPRILEWRDMFPDITFVFGWEVEAGARIFCFDGRRDSQEFDGLEVFAVYHSFDNIPEAAFLIKTDGLTIFHSGDHGSTGPEINPIFKQNIDRLSRIAEEVDIAFVSQFGSTYGDEVNKGDLYTMERLSPRVLFPMHQGEREHNYLKFAREAEAKGVPTEIACARNRGDQFFYGEGKWKRLD